LSHTIVDWLHFLQTAWRHSKRWLAGAAFAAALAAIFILPVLSVSWLTLQPGDVAPRDVRSPRRISYVSDILTQKARDQAEASVQLVYTPPDSRAARQQITFARRVMDSISAARSDITPTLAQKWATLEDIPDLSLTNEQAQAILSFNDEAWSEVETEVVDVVAWMMRFEIRQDDLAQARARVPFMVSLTLTEEQAVIASALAQQFIAPNSFPDADATAAARAKARQSVTPVTRSYEAGEIVVREGQILTDLDVEALDHLGLRHTQTSGADYAAAALYGVVIAVLLGLYTWRCEPALWRHSRQLMWSAALFLLFALVARVMVPAQSVLPYLFPAAALPMLVGVLVGPNLAVALAIAMGIVAAALGSTPEVIVFVTSGGLVGALSLGQAERLSVFSRSALYVALSNIAILLAFRLPAGITDPLSTLMLFAAGIANGSLAASLTVGGLFVVSTPFDRVTTVRLQELAQATHPLLELLLTKAPGTYHHTRTVANLAEQAAERIGADALLTRVGALYHDIGKTSQPYAFIENQKDGANIHDTLDARMSAQIIRLHVDDGLELARHYHLPRRIQAFIPEHHGSMRVSFLYDQAVREAGGDASKVNEQDFRYRGPKPQSKETALVMLADGCEAATRATHPSSASQIRETVNKAIADRIAQGQLNECPLTLHDLDLIRESFVLTLQGISHPRIQYPDQVPMLPNAVQQEPATRDHDAQNSQG
jgi:putative nucleotidyltransferase with HDIG domain